MVRQKKSVFCFVLSAAVILTMAFLSGCGPSIKYAYDSRAGFPEMKTYQWAASTGIYRLDPLLEANVQVFADKALGKKGFTRKTDKADLVVWMNYEAEYNKTFQLRMLTLNIARADNREMVWRGTATGDIKTDAASKDLEEIVEGILLNFPPK
jgi:hypothetical protein